MLLSILRRPLGIFTQCLLIDFKLKQPKIIKKLKFFILENLWISSVMNKNDKNDENDKNQSAYLYFIFVIFIIFLIFVIYFTISKCGSFSTYSKNALA